MWVDLGKGTPLEFPHLLRLAPGAGRCAVTGPDREQPSEGRQVWKSRSILAQ
jgi:hypothetical protein